MRVLDQHVVCVGFAQYVDLSAALDLSTDPTAGGGSGVALPTGAQFVLLQADTQDVRWRPDGVNPTAAIGFLLSTLDAGFWYTGKLSGLRFIQAAPGAKLNVAYYAEAGPH